MRVFPGGTYPGPFLLVASRTESSTGVLPQLAVTAMTLRHGYTYIGFLSTITSIVEGISFERVFLLQQVEPV